MSLASVSDKLTVIRFCEFCFMYIYKCHREGIDPSGWSCLFSLLLVDVHRYIGETKCNVIILGYLDVLDNRLECNMVSLIETNLVIDKCMGI